MTGRTNAISPAGGGYTITNELETFNGVLSSINGQQVEAGQQIILKAGDYIRVHTPYGGIVIKTEDGYDVPLGTVGNFPDINSSETVMRAPPMIQGFFAIMPNRNIIISS